MRAAVSRRTLGADEPPAGDTSRLVSGVVTAVEPRALRLETRDGPALLTVGNDATMRRLGPARLADYFPGDEVVAEGRWEDGAFACSSVEAMFHVVSGEITARSGSRLETPSAAIRLTGDTRAAASLDVTGSVYVAKPLDDLAVGDEVIACGLFEPRTCEFVADDIGARAT